MHLLQEGKTGKMIPCGRNWYLFSHLLKLAHALWRPQLFQKMASVLRYFYLLGFPLKFPLVCRQDGGDKLWGKKKKKAPTSVKLKILLKPTFSYNLRFSFLWSSACLWSYIFWMFKAIFSSMPPFFNNLSAWESRKLWDLLHGKNLHPPWRKCRQIWSLLQLYVSLHLLALLL